MRYGSLCSGIEAATVAWHPLGWTPAFFAEIEKFPSAVLAHHYASNMPGEALTHNGVPNLGDITRFKEWPDAAIDVLVGGTPCQSFSVAGLRKGLADPRGNLALTYLAIADRYRPEWLVWENVPGVLSSTSYDAPDPCPPPPPLDLGCDGAEVDTEDEFHTEELHALNSFLAGLSELGYGWALRVLDAQYVRVDGFGRAVPQRRRRVFVVGNSRDWRRAAAVLFERESLSGNSAPRREAGQRTTHGVAPSLVSSGRGAERAGDTRGQDPVVAVAYGGNNCSGPVDVSTSLQAHPGPAGRIDFASETFVAVAPCLDANYGRLQGHDDQHIEGGAGLFVRSVAKTLTRGAESAGKGGYAGRRQEDDDNLVATPIAYRTAGDGAVYEEGPVVAPLTTNTDPSANLVAFQESESGFRLSDTHATLDANNGSRRHNGVLIPPAVAFTCSEQANSFAWERDVYPTLDAQIPNDSSNIQKGIRQGWAVRRLTPTECERLQGFPDGYTDIKDTTPDGPRYKALGNSMAVNVMRWIGTRIAMVQQLADEIDKAEAA